MTDDAWRYKGGNSRFAEQPNQQRSYRARQPINMRLQQEAYFSEYPNLPNRPPRPPFPARPPFQPRPQFRPQARGPPPQVNRAAFPRGPDHQQFPHYSGEPRVRMIRVPQQQQAGPPRPQLHPDQSLPQQPDPYYDGYSYVPNPQTKPYDPTYDTNQAYAEDYIEYGVSVENPYGPLAYIEDY